MLLTDALTDFILACKADGLQAKTVRWYDEKLTRFVNQVGTRPLEDVGAMEVRHFIISLREQNQQLSSETLRGYDRALRRFWNWITAEYNLDPVKNPMTRIRRPPKPEPAPKPMLMSDFKRMLNICDEETAIGLRNRAILLFLADTGARSGGLRGLRVQDLELDRLRAVVREKRDRARYVFMLPITAAAIRRWMDVRPPTTVVFCSMSTRAYGRPISMAGLHRILFKLGTEARCSGPVNPHSIRKMFAIQNLELGNDVFTVSSLLGHADLKTTEYYARFAEAQRQHRHDLFSPVRHLEIKDG